MGEELEEIPPPIGDFVINNAKGTMGNDGMYYHYSDVCKLLRLYHEEKSKEVKAKISTPKSTMAFHKWLISEGWHEHSSNKYWYKSEDFHQWPPDETASEEELTKKFFG